MFSVGRVCVKLAGRDAGMKCVIVEVLDHNHVLIDGETRRRKCNVKHLEPLTQTADISKSATPADVAAAMKKLGFGTKEHKKGKKVHAQVKKTKTRAQKAKPVVAPKAPGAAKKAAPKKEVKEAKSEKKE